MYIQCLHVDFGFTETVLKQILSYLDDLKTTCPLTMFLVLLEHIIFDLRRLVTNSRFITNTEVSTLIYASNLQRVDHCNSLIRLYSRRVIQFTTDSELLNSNDISHSKFVWHKITYEMSSLAFSKYKDRITACLCHHCNSRTVPLYVTDVQHKKP